MKREFFNRVTIATIICVSALLVISTYVLFRNEISVIALENKMWIEAEQGGADAQNFLGVAYAEGRGVTQEYAKAVYLFRKAAEQGYAEAQNNLGVAYATGRGVPQDDAQAVHWYRKAAEQDHARAQTLIGVAYSEGRGVPQNDA